VLELSVAPASAFPENRQMRADLAEIAALKNDVVRLRAERDILKKAAGFVAREEKGESHEPDQPGSAGR
jgi:transposase